MNQEMESSIIHQNPIRKHTYKQNPNKKKKKKKKVITFFPYELPTFAQSPHKLPTRPK